MTSFFNGLLDRFPDFGKGYGLGLFFGAPLLAFLISTNRANYFGTSYVREIVILLIWLTGFVALTQVRIKKIGKEGVEFHDTVQGIKPGEELAKPAAPPQTTPTA